MKSWPCLLTLLLMLAGCRPTPDPFTFSDALQRLQDPSLLAIPPDGLARMISSYDRSGGNLDHRNFQGIEPNGDYLLADLKGPGCLTRIWFTGIPDTARMAFHFDGEKTARLSVTVRELKDGTMFPFLKPLCTEPSGAVVSYLPLPYAKRLKVTVTPDREGHYYYQINHTELPRRTVSFPAALSEKERQELDRTLHRWEHPESLFTLQPESQPDLILPPGMETEIFTSTEAGLLTAWALHFPDRADATHPHLLSKLLLKIHWDASESASVQVPLNGFFCNPLRPRAFTSLPLAQRDGVYHCRFPMPFRNGARICLVNQSSTPVRVRFVAAQSPLPNRPVFYFHAAHAISTRSGTPFQLPDIQGDGWFAGTGLLAYATHPVSWNILEGDEHFIVDGKSETGFYGTGLEDYFNGGWYYCEGAYLAPLSGVTDRSAVKTAQYRFHCEAPIRFRKSFHADFEFGHANTSAGFFAGTAFWYQSKPAAVPGPMPQGQRVGPPDPLEPHAFLCEILETERRGNTFEATALCREFIEKYPKTPQAAMYELRAQAYAQHAGTLKKIHSQDSAPAEIHEQANLLNTFHSQPDATLVSAHVNGRFRLYLNGEPLLQGNDWQVQYTALTRLPPGTHTLLMEVHWTQPDNWINAHLRTRNADLHSGPDWECAPTRDARDWQPCVHRGYLPKMQWVSFQPNAMVYTQHHALTGPPPGQDAPGKTSWFRKTFTLE